MKYSAFLFDLNGTMIDDMRYHVQAWHDLFNAMGAGISMSRMKEECYGRNDELIERIFPGRFSVAEKQQLSVDKEIAYQDSFRPSLRLIDGLPRFLHAAYEAGIPMAIGSAALMMNIDFVLDGLEIRHYFNALISADDVVHSKPDPETYLKCAAALGVEPGRCLVFEDAPKGVESAANADMDSLVIRGIHTDQEFNGLPGIIRFLDDYTNLSLLRDFS